jgi:hypothetical protein
MYSILTVRLLFWTASIPASGQMSRDAPPVARTHSADTLEGAGLARLPDALDLPRSSSVKKHIPNPAKGAPVQKIPLDLARPDMILAKAVLRDNGMVLVADGTTLTPSLLDRLKSMNVEHLVVEGNPVDLGGGGGMGFAQRIERLDHLFRKHGDDPWMQKVKAFARAFFAKKAAAQAAPRPATPGTPESPPGGAP